MTLDRVWWQQPFRMFQTNLREIDAASLDVDATLDYLEDFGADTWLLSVGGILSNYPSALESQTPNPFLAHRAGGDLIGEAVSGAQARGIRVLARMDFSKVDHRRAERHPEWCFVDPDGRRQVYNGQTSVCPSASYYQERSFEVVAEVLNRYAVSGFFFNWLTYNEIDYSRHYRGVCQCVACARNWQHHAPGRPLPAGPQSADYDEWRRFTDRALEDLTARMRSFIEERSADAVFVQGTSADILFHEANNAVGRPLWHHRTSDEVVAARVARPHTPVLVNSVAFVDMPYRMAGEDPAHFSQHILQTIARGGIPSTYIMGSPVDSPYDALPAAADLTRFHRDHSEVYTDLLPAAHTLLVRPDVLSRSADAHETALDEFRGISTMLVERHVPFDVVDERWLGSLPAADGHRLIIVPDLGQLPGDIVARLDRAVERGATVLTTGTSDLGSEGSALAGSPVAQVLARLQGVDELLSMHVRTSTEDPWGDPVAVVGSIDLVSAVEDALVAMPVVGRAPFGPPEKSYGNENIDAPGVLWRAVGAGAVSVIPWTIGRAFRATGASRIGDTFVAHIAVVSPAAVIDTGLAPHAEIVLGRSAVGPVAHILNRSGDRDGRFVEPVPIAAGRLVLPWPGVTSVRALRAGVILSAQAVDRGIVVDVPEVALFDVLVALEGNPA